jgi:hypothetical protein
VPGISAEHLPATSQIRILVFTIPSKPGTEASIRKFQGKIEEIHDRSRRGTAFLWLITTIVGILYVGPTGRATALLVLLIVTAVLASIYSVATERWFVVKIVDA